MQMGSTITFEHEFVDGDGVPIDISGATTKEIILKHESPSETKKVFIADFVTDGIDGQLKYKTSITDIDIEGIWKSQGHYINTTTSEEFYSDIVNFPMKENL